MRTIGAIVYKQFDQSTVTAVWHELLRRCRAKGWHGSVNGRRGGSRSYAMQLALYQLWKRGLGAPAFSPGGPSRHMRRNIEREGGWYQAVDVQRPTELMSVARRMGADLHQPYPREPWHVEARRSFTLLAPGVRGIPLKTRPLLRTLKDAGIVYPKITIEVAHSVGLPLAIACALLEQESSGGHNVFGHDAVRNPIKGGPVTRERYAQYVANRKAGLGMQGVGPCQLTWYEFQNRADLLGGCWQPGPNMRVGFGILKALIQRNGLRLGCRAYNGTGAGAERYADQVVARVAKWRQILS